MSTVTEAVQSSITSSLPEIMTPLQLSLYLGLSLHTLQRYRCERIRNPNSKNVGPKFKKVGNKIFYKVRDVQAWIEACGRDSTRDSRINE
jgi:hypothetical protein